MFLDIAIGIFAGLSVGSFYFETVPYWFVILGILFALLPDIDGALWILKPSVRKEWYKTHRTYTGYPFLYIPIAVIVFVVFGKPIGILFSVCILWHHIHDTFFLGWGVMWLWPFSKRKWKFFPDKDGKISFVPIISWLPHQEEKIRQWSGGHDEGWIKRYYLQPNFIAYLEYGTLIVACLCLYGYYL